MDVYKIDEIAKVLATVKDEKQIEAFLKSIFISKVITDISSRWELVKMLDQGFSQRHIAQELGLSLCKITRGSRELKKKNSPFKYFIDKIK
jgi:TrpR family transcriptional regulator, trp operon repressor